MQGTGLAEPDPPRDCRPMGPIWAHRFFCARCVPRVNLGDDVRLGSLEVTRSNDRHLTQVQVSSHGGVHRSEKGIGDANVWLRVAPVKYLGIDFPCALRGGVKLPIGSAPIDAEIIPLSEGQTDWEMLEEVGHSF